MYVTSLLAMFLVKLAKRIRDVYASAPRIQLAFALPPHALPEADRVIRDACAIAMPTITSSDEHSEVFGIDTRDAVQCVVAAYARKLCAVTPADRPSYYVRHHAHHHVHHHRVHHHPDHHAHRVCAHHHRA